MKKLLALLLSLLMLIAPAAMAEDSTRYTLSLMDPQVFMNGEVIADMTGLNLDVDAAVTDSGLIGLILTLFAGENYDYVTSLTAQLDNKGLVAYLNGMTDGYYLDLTPYVGMNPAPLLGMFAPRTMLNSIDPAAMAIPEPDFSGEARLSAVESWIAPRTYDNLSDGATTTRHFSITREEGAESIAAAKDLLSSFVDTDTASIESFELSGAIVTTEGVPGCTIEADGRVNFVDTTNSTRFNIPIKLTYTDDVASATLDVTVSDPAGSDEEIKLYVSSFTTPTENGKTDVFTAATITVDGESMTLSFAVAPNFETEEVTYSLGLEIPETENSFTLALSTGIYPEGDGFMLSLGTVEDGEEVYMDIWYQGDDYSDPDLGDYKSGWFEVDVYQGEESYGAGLYVLMYKEDLDSGDWALNSEHAVDAASLTDDQTNALLTEAVTVLQNAIATLQQQVPGIALLTGVAAQ